MRFVAELPQLPVDPLAIARRLVSEPDLAVLWDASGARTAWIACRALETRHELDPEPSLLLSPHDASAGTPRWIGIVPYEAMRKGEREQYVARPDPRPAPPIARPVWKRYDALVEVTNRVRVIGDEPAAVERLVERCLGTPERPSDEARLVLDSEEHPSAHTERIRRALELIARGEIYEVNLARELRFSLRGSTLALAARLAERTRAPYSALMHLGDLEFVASSPELCLELRGDRRIWTSPIKGTRPRGTTPERDRALIDELDADPKERAELTMVIDVERNDLGRICRNGSVRLAEPPHIETHPTLHHRVAIVAGELRDGVDRTSVLEAMLPSGSVTGAPKLRAMELIAELESARRGAYTGAFGFIGQDGGLRLAMAIRVLTIRGGSARYLVGGGIVADSDPEREVEETRWKASHLLDLDR